jgi:hypothetical protein
MSTKAFITKYCNLGGWTNTNLFFSQFWRLKVKIKVRACFWWGLFSWLTDYHPLCLQPAFLSVCALEDMLVSPLFIKTSALWDEGPTLWVHLTLIVSVKDLSSSTVSLGFRSVTYELELRKRIHLITITFFVHLLNTCLLRIFCELGFLLTYGVLY